jgi:hypothetical protein
MAWVRLDDVFDDHPKLLGLPLECVGLHVFGLTYSARHLTDGALTPPIVSHLSRGRDDLAQQLVDAGLWEALDGGWQIHDFLDYNPSREQVEADRKAARERMRNVRANTRRTSAAVPGRDRHWKAVRKVDQEQLPDGLSTVLVARASDVLDTLRRIHADRGGNTPTLRGVGLALQAYPDRDHQTVAGELEHWALAGSGQQRTIRDWARMYRAFLERAPTATPTVTTPPGVTAGGVVTERDIRSHNKRTVIAEGMASLQRMADEHVAQNGAQP